ncbi:MAG: hypothetical protein F6J97_25935 [Leptolyngbya sp. SIO4C1]|nr:hypothetical protein [Leptolyngbya sp. SIO4C1]
MPRRQSPSSTSEATGSGHKARVRFVFEPDRSSPNGITYAWLIHETYKGKEKAATAVRAFWLPFAYRDSGEHSEAELKELAQQSIWRMEEQIQHLREAFGLESTPAMIGAAEVASDVSSPSADVDLPASDKPSLPRGDISVLAQDELLDDFSDVL